MSLTEQELKIQKDSIDWISKKENQERLIKRFILDKKPFSIGTVAIFMAGSPGAGKTEYSEDYEIGINKDFKKMRSLNFKNLNPELVAKILNSENLIVRLDVDEIRENIPYYKKTDPKTETQGNAHLVQKAAGMGLDLLRKYCIENDVSFLLDGTFGNQHSTFEKMIRRLINSGRSVSIFLIYNHPLVSWQFTKEREHMEGRNVKKDNFIDQYFKSIDNIRRIKEKFGSDVILNCVLKKDDNTQEKVYFNRSFEEVENILEKRYNFSQINKAYLEDNLN